MAIGRHGNAPVSKTFLQLMGQLVRSPDSFPLLGALGTAATMMTGFIVYQFYTRPDFKALRIKSNAKDGIDKPINYYGNRLVWIGSKKDLRPQEVKEVVEAVRPS